MKQYEKSAVESRRRRQKCAIGYREDRVLSQMKKSTHGVSTRGCCVGGSHHTHHAAAVAAMKDQAQGFHEGVIMIQRPSSMLQNDIIVLDPLL
jgi:hypothetical protein